MQTIRTSSTDAFGRKTLAMKALHQGQVCFVEECRPSRKSFQPARKYVMEMFTSPQFWSALGAIILIDLVLAGDNALVIAMAARKLPDNLRRKAILWGTVGAIVVRSAMTMAVVWLLMIPGLRLIGGLLLIWIAIKLLAPQEDEEHEAADNFWSAMKTIIIADAVMGVDNVLAVAGAAHGSFLLVVLGLLISIPIVVWGSTLVLKMIDKYPIIIYLGAAVLAYTAAVMIWDEPILKPYFKDFAGFKYPFVAVVVALTLAAAKWFSGRAIAKQAAAQAAK
jgi:YjbE family integral membrane protein